MIALIIKTYLMVILSIGAICLSILIFGLYLLFKPSSSRTPSRLLWHNLNEHDLSSISGENVFSTQLDLARAYIETNHTHLAKQILDDVLAQGSDKQKQEAQKLLASCHA